MQPVDRSLLGPKDHELCQHIKLYTLAKLKLGSNLEFPKSLKSINKTRMRNLNILLLAQTSIMIILLT
jgi:hypothetical protein